VCSHRSVLPMELCAYDACSMFISLMSVHIQLPNASELSTPSCMLLKHGCSTTCMNSPRPPACNHFIPTHSSTSATVAASPLPLPPAVCSPVPSAHAASDLSQMMFRSFIAPWRLSLSLYVSPSLRLRFRVFSCSDACALTWRYLLPVTIAST
jgi:hypothetical protein